MAKAKILFADDDASLRNAMRVILKRAGYATVEASSGKETLEVFSREQPDLVLLDVIMPGMDGFETCRKLRELSSHVPVLFLSVRDEIEDKKIAFGTGADGYITKPFDREELLLHVDALLRRAALAHRPEQEQANSSETAPCRIEHNGMLIDLHRREVSIEGKPISLTPIEYGILALLGEEPGRVCSRDVIAKRVWGNEYTGREVAIPTHIRHLREKIESDPSSPTYIKTVGRFGYRLGD